MYQSSTVSATRCHGGERRDSDTPATKKAAEDYVTKLEGGWTKPISIYPRRDQDLFSNVHIDMIIDTKYH